MELKPEVVQKLKESWYQDLTPEEKAAIACMIILESGRSMTTADFGARVGAMVGAAQTVEGVLENLRQV